MPRTATPRNLITAAAAIVKMYADEREVLLLNILARHPASVITVMSENGITFNDKISQDTYKVVVVNKGEGKIALIKLFREVTSNGLADSKAWTEGSTINGLAAGVFAVGKTKEEADALADAINAKGAISRIRVLPLRESVPYTADTNWAADAPY